MATRITQLTTDRPIVESDGSLTLQSRAYFKVLTDRALIIGSGNPSGITEAEQGASYMDEDAALGSIFYLKQKSDIGGDKSMGWVLIG